MCDTYVVLPDTAKTGTTVLGKNSDRPAFDCQPMAYHGRKKHKKEDKLKLVYLSIDQVEESYATMGSSPYWCWGYEEGINEYGVAIGNEAIYTKDLTENTELEKMGTPVKKVFWEWKFSDWVWKERKRQKKHWMLWQNW